jgi:hypothetical protein
MNAYSIKSNEDIYLPLDFKSNTTSMNGGTSNQNGGDKKKIKNDVQFYEDYLNKTNNSNSLEGNNNFLSIDRMT